MYDPTSHPHFKAPALYLAQDYVWPLIRQVACTELIVTLLNQDH